MEPRQTTTIYRAPRSEEVEEIINRPPSWLISWGITIFFVILIILFTTAWVIRYPDIIIAPFRLTAQNAPKSVTSKIDGKIIKLFVKNNSLVKQNEVLGYMESVADHSQVLSLAEEIQKIQNAVERESSDFKLLQYNQLGELQSDYQNFNKEYIQFLAFQSNGYYLKKRKLLENELHELGSIEKNIIEQKGILEKNLNISEEEFKIQEDLAKQKVIAPLELKREESKLLDKKMPLKLLESALYNNSNNKISKQKEILELDKLIHEHQNTFLQSLNTLKSAIESWKRKYVITSPIAGKVYFSSFIEERQNLTINQELFFIGAEGISYFGEVNIPQQNLGKVKVGQDVIVKFDSYPYYEFGSIKGKVAFISEITDKENNFLIKVELPKGLITSSGHPIQYKTGMKASAEIVTKDMRLIERFFQQLNKSLSK